MEPPSGALLKFQFRGIEASLTILPLGFEAYESGLERQTGGSGNLCDMFTICRPTQGAFTVSAESAILSNGDSAKPL